MNARDRIMGRVRAATLGREAVEHPGAFGGWRPSPPAENPVDAFNSLFEAAGGEVVRARSLDDAARWLADFQRGFDSVTTGVTVPRGLHTTLPPAPPQLAPLAVSRARGAVAETGSLLLDARDGRRTQLLAPTHVVFVRSSEVHATFHEALTEIIEDLPSAVALHSGPSKSADIGQILVRGVHGPGRIIAVVIEDR